jgi:hypothetical protein
LQHSKMGTRQLKEKTVTETGILQDCWATKKNDV